eukprot:scaffold1754_cov180-Ochromonas_danica.AAC.6
MAAAVGDQRRKKEAMELLVTEIAKGEEDRIAPQLRTVIERGWLDSFPTILNEAKKKKDAEIDRICSRHYGDFLNSVNEMLNMENNIKTLKASVVNVHEKFTSKGGDLVQVLESLSRIQHEREHTRKALEATMLCKDVAMLMVQAKKEIEEDDYYAAMRTVENIKSHLTNPDLQPLVKTLEVWLPMTVNKLLYGVRSEADLFITQLRQSTGLLGNTVLLRQARLSANLEANLRNGSGSGSVTTASSNFGNTRRPTVLTPVKTLPGIMMAGAAVGGGGGGGTIGVIKEGAELLDQRLSELPALHKAYHLYAVLGQGATFLEHYNDLRDHHFKQILKQFEVEINRSSNPNGLMGCIPRFLDQIVGFFTLECIFYRVLNQTVVGYSIGSGSNGNGGEVEDSLKEYWKQALTSLQHLDRIEIDHEVFLNQSNGGNGNNATMSTSGIGGGGGGGGGGGSQQMGRRGSSMTSFSEGSSSSRSATGMEMKSGSTGSTNNGVGSNESIERKGQQQRILMQHLDANLDALEEEIGLHAPSAVTSNSMGNTGSSGSSGGGGGTGPSTPTKSSATTTITSFATPPTMSNGGGAGGGGGGGGTGMFLAQTYPFSEFVPLVCQELHAALIRTLLYLFIKPPDSLLVLLHNINPAITVAAAAANNRTKSTTLTASSSSSSSSSSAFLAAGYDSSSSLLTISEGRRQATFQGNTNNTNGGGVVVPLSPMNNVSSAKGNTTQQNATSTTTTTGGAISPSPVVALSSNLPRLEKNMTRTWAKKLRAQAQKEE